MVKEVEINQDLSGEEDYFPLEDKTIKKFHMGAHGSSRLSTEENPVDG